MWIPGDGILNSTSIAWWYWSLILFCFHYWIKPDLTNLSVSSVTGDGRKKQRKKQEDEKGLKAKETELPTFPLQRARTSSTKAEGAQDSGEKGQKEAKNPPSGKPRATTIPPERNVPPRTICP